MKFEVEPSMDSDKFEILKYDITQMYKGSIENLQNLHDVLCSIRYELKANRDTYKLKREEEVYYRRAKKLISFKDKFYALIENLKGLFSKIEKNEEINYEVYEEVLKMLDEMINELDDIINRLGKKP
mgnify:CR=1 FL=1